MPRPRVLVLCTGNSCRSQIGEGWVRHLLGDRVDLVEVSPGDRRVELELDPLLAEKAREFGRRVVRRFEVARSLVSARLGVSGRRPLAVMETINDRAAARYAPRRFGGRIVPCGQDFGGMYRPSGRVPLF